MSDFPEPVHTEIEIEATFTQVGDDDDLYQNDERRKELAAKVRKALNDIPGIEVNALAVGGWRV